jgi:hypothetical protein
VSSQFFGSIEDPRSLFIDNNWMDKHLFQNLRHNLISHKI